MTVCGACLQNGRLWCMWGGGRCVARERTRGDTSDAQTGGRRVVCVCVCVCDAVCVWSTHESAVEEAGDEGCLHCRWDAASFCSLSYYHCWCALICGCVCLCRSFLCQMCEYRERVCSIWQKKPWNRWSRIERRCQRLAIDYIPLIHLSVWVPSNALHFS